MNTRLRLVLIFVAATLDGTRPAAAAQDNSWVGKYVLPTKPNNDIQVWDRLDDNKVSLPLSDEFGVKVQADSAGWLHIHDGDRDGWVAKTDFVVLQDAPAY